jgi:predicted PurR-regulated permease PerM
MNGTPARSNAFALVPLILVVATLYVARDFFIPLALAILISFLLTPLIRRLERWRFHRIAAVLTATFLSFALMGGLLFVMGGQVIDLANGLDKYKSNLKEKVSALKIRKDGPITKATETLKDVTTEMSKEDTVTTAISVQDGEAAAAPLAPPIDLEAGVTPRPVQVAVVESPGNALEAMKEFAMPLLGPLGTAALVIVFVIFILLQLEDLRDRVIHLIGRGNLQITTQALDDAGKRVTKYLLAQLIVNVTYGIPIGIGLYFIGIPNAILWALLAIVLRFVPYIGPWIAASFPIALSLAVSPGWSVPLLTIGLFVVIELISNNVVEPWLYGASTGLSPIAVIVSAAFWTWLWGPIGLLLATPLTVCIAVLGKYIPSLSFLDVLLGDKPPIAVKDRFYQRLLAEDEEEICEISEKYTEENSLVETFEEVMIPALRLVESDFKRGLIDESKRHDMHLLVRDLVLDVSDEQAPAVREKTSKTGSPTTTPLPDAPPAVLFLPACNESDELCAHMLARLLANSGVAAQVCPSKLLTSEMVAQASELTTNLMLVSVLPPKSIIPATLVCKRLRVSVPQARIMVGVWGEGTLDDKRRSRFERANADIVVTSLTQAEREIIAQVAEALPLQQGETDTAPRAA